MSRLLYRFIAHLARLAVRSGRWKDLQIIVLRHENSVLRRQADRPALNDDDRTAQLPSTPSGPCAQATRHLRHRPNIQVAVDHYNTHRPQRSLNQQPPRPTGDEEPADTPQPDLTVVQTTRCNGLINEYRRAA